MNNFNQLNVNERNAHTKDRETVRDTYATMRELKLRESNLSYWRAIGVDCSRIASQPKYAKSHTHTQTQTECKQQK